MLRALVDHHLEHPDQIPATYREAGAPLVTQVADYVAGMTDRYALSTYAHVFGVDAAAARGLPGSWAVPIAVLPQHHLAWSLPAFTLRSAFSWPLQGPLLHKYDDSPHIPGRGWRQ